MSEPFDGVKYLKPYDYQLLNTNLVDSSIADFDIATTYTKNSIIKKYEKVYMSRTDNNIGNEPSINPLFWRRIGTINTQAWRDDSFFTQSASQDEIILEFFAPSAESIAFANLEATQVAVEQINDAGTIVNTLTKDLSSSPAWDWIAYWYYEPIYTKRTRISIPLVDANILRIRIKNTGSIARVGNMQLGTVNVIGCESYGTTTEHRLVKTPNGEVKSVLDVDFKMWVKSDDRIALAGSVARLKDTFTFFFFGDNTKETVCAKTTAITTAHESRSMSTINLNLEGINDDQ